jgi:hypothetical protein
MLNPGFTYGAADEVADDVSSGVATGDNPMTGGNNKDHYFKF